jgi:hypothetical protein
MRIYVKPGSIRAARYGDISTTVHVVIKISLQSMLSALVNSGENRKTPFPVFLGKYNFTNVSLFVLNSTVSLIA